EEHGARDHVAHREPPEAEHLLVEGRGAVGVAHVEHSVVQAGHAHGCLLESGARTKRAPGTTAVAISGFPHGCAAEATLSRLSGRARPAAAGRWVGTRAAAGRPAGGREPQAVGPIDSSMARISSCTMFTA